MFKNQQVIASIAFVLLMTFVGTEVRGWVIDETESAIEKRDAEEKLKEKSESKGKNWLYDWDSPNGNALPPHLPPTILVIQEHKVRIFQYTYFQHHHDIPLFILYCNLKVDC